MRACLWDVSVRGRPCGFCCQPVLSSTLAGTLAWRPERVCPVVPVIVHVLLVACSVRPGLGKGVRGWTLIVHFFPSLLGALIIDC